MSYVVSVCICVTFDLCYVPFTSDPSHWKDGIVLVLLALCVVLFFSAIFQRRYAQKRIDSFLEESRVYEKELSELKIK